MPVLAMLLVFLRIGCTAWGGFVALISVVRHEIVDRRKLIAEEDFLDDVALAMVMPGPVAMNLVALVGHKLRGPWGSVLATTAVTLPSFALMLLLSFLFFGWGQSPMTDRFLVGIYPAIAALIVHTAWGMRGKALGGWLDYTLAVLALLVTLLLQSLYGFLALIALGGIYGLFTKPQNRTDAATTPETTPERGPPLGWVHLLALVGVLTCLVSFVVPWPGQAEPTLLALSSAVSGLSLMLFGGGFVFIPLIQDVFVGQFEWIETREFTTAIAMGQVTPGPILISATFIGYKLGGVVGAALATIAMFGPPAVLIVLTKSALARYRHLATIAAFQAGVRVVIVGMIFAAGLTLMRSGLELTGDWTELLTLRRGTIAMLFLANLILLRFFAARFVIFMLISGAVGMAV
ncbi:MAG: chromate efflux transporter [Alphaproteobacteria bacterium]